MRALVLERPGPPEALRWENLPDPEPRADEVLVRLTASGVCHHDVLARRGRFPRTQFPVTLGHEVAGVVVAVGPDARDVAVGDRVVATTIVNCGRCPACRAGNDQLCRSGRGVLGETVSGGYAELVAIPDRAAVRIPDAVGDAEAAVTPCALGTAYHALEVLALEPGTPIVVTGASGGVGLHAVTLGAGLGLRVIAVTGSDAKVDALEAAGAADVVVAPDGVYAAQVRSLVDDGVSAVLDVTCTSLGESLRSLSSGGRVVVLGNLGDPTVPLQPALLILKELTVAGSRGASRSQVEALLALVAEGRVRPHVVVAGGPEEIPAIHRDLEARTRTGKVTVCW